LSNSQVNFQLYTGLPQVKISQEVLGGYFFDTYCILSFCAKAAELSNSIRLNPRWRTDGAHRYNSVAGCSI